MPLGCRSGEQRILTRPIRARRQPHCRRPGGHGAPLSSLHRYPNEDTGDHRNVATASGRRYASTSIVASRFLGQRCVRRSAPRARWEQGMCLPRGPCGAARSMQSRSMWRAHGIRLPRFRTLMSRIEQRPRMMIDVCARPADANGPGRGVAVSRVIDPRARPRWAVFWGDKRNLRKKRSLDNGR